ncbi:hypothetical protein D5085_13325 [Ectothiorhodospiraceae bacterium BW-2]|nr:hypothetical protein D5085_13325 [Ectothiorhodospiraceae bacterium BW-2]
MGEAGVSELDGGGAESTVWHNLSAPRESWPLLQPLAERFELTLTEAGAECGLVWRDGAVELAYREPQGEPNRLGIDWQQGRLRYRLQQLGQRRELLLRAVQGRRCQQPLQIVDMTAGLGSDALLLAVAGHHLTLFERFLPLAVLLADAMHRSRADTLLAEALSRMSLYYGDSSQFAPRLMRTQIDVVCLDPMFPARQKSAKTRKELSLLQQLLGHATEADQAQLLTLAKEVAERRVVVKRPLKAAPLAQSKPDTALCGSHYRYDIYLN